MCFKVITYTVPRTTTVYKIVRTYEKLRFRSMYEPHSRWLEETLSPHAKDVLEYYLGVETRVEVESAVTRRGSSDEGIYVFLDLDQPRRWLKWREIRGWALLSCKVKYKDFLVAGTGKRPFVGFDCATYRAITPIEVIPV